MSDRLVVPMTKAWRALSTACVPSTRSANESGVAARSRPSAKPEVISLSVLPVERHRLPLAAVVQVAAVVVPAPDDHLRAGPDRRVVLAYRRCARRRRRGPGVRDRVVTAAVVQVSAAAVPAPDDHPRAGPDRRMEITYRRRTRCRRRRPGVRDRVVLAAVVQGSAAVPAPDDHPR